MSKKIHQGDQYYIPFNIKMGSVVVTPDIADDLRIKIGDQLYSYSDGDIIFDTDENMWKVSITQEMSRGQKIDTMYQVGIKIGDDIMYSDVKPIRVERSIIEEDW